MFLSGTKVRRRLRPGGVAYQVRFLGTRPRKYTVGVDLTVKRQVVALITESSILSAHPTFSLEKTHMKTYLSDHERLIKLENEIKQLVAILHQHIASSVSAAPPFTQAVRKVRDFNYTADETLQAMDLWMERDSQDGHIPHKVLKLIRQFDIWKRCSGK